MNWLNAAVGELFSLFVDDVWFSVGILAWVMVCTLLLPLAPIAPIWEAPLLFLGCAVILVVSTWRAARA